MKSNTTASGCWRGAEPRGVRLFTRNGHDSTERFPLIFEALSALKVSTCLIDGEGVTCNESGLADFEGLRSRRGHAHLRGTFSSARVLRTLLRQHNSQNLLM